MNILSGIESTSSALNAERLRMEVVSQNIANANTTGSPDGTHYKRQQISFESVIRNQMGPNSWSFPLQEVRVSGITSDDAPPRLIYKPGHPHADADGMVAMPNINVHEEMVDLMAASRAFEANLAVVQTAKQIAQRTLTIGQK